MWTHVSHFHRGSSSDSKPVSKGVATRLSMSISSVHRSAIYHIMSSLLLRLCDCEATTMWFSTLWPVLVASRGAWFPRPLYFGRPGPSILGYTLSPPCMVHNVVTHSTKNILLIVQKNIFNDPCHHQCESLLFCTTSFHTGGGKDH